MAAMFSILRRSYGAAVSSSSIIIPRFAPLISPRFVSTSSYNDVSFHSNTHSNAINTFNILIRDGVSPIPYYNSILSNLAVVGSYVTVLSLYNQLEQSSQFNNLIVPDVNTWAILIQCHSRQGNMSSAISLLHKIIDTGHHPTTQTLNHILRGFCRLRQIHQAMKFYNDTIVKNRSKCVLDYNSYLILIPELCEIGETQMALELLGHAFNIDNCFGNDDSISYRFQEKEDSISSRSLMRCFHSILSGLCKDRLLNQAYDLCSEMIHVKNIKPDYLTYINLIYGHCIISQFKQALILRQVMDTTKSTLYPDPHTLVSTAATTPHNLVTEQEVKSAKTAAAVMIKCGVKPNAASYHTVMDRLYKGRSTTDVMNKIAYKVEDLLLAQRYYNRTVDDSAYPECHF